jgi:hypothetical protein
MFISNHYEGKEKEGAYSVIDERGGSISIYF